MSATLTEPILGGHTQAALGQPRLEKDAVRCEREDEAAAVTSGYPAPGEIIEDPQAACAKRSADLLSPEAADSKALGVDDSVGGEVPIKRAL